MGSDDEAPISWRQVGRAKRNGRLHRSNNGPASRSVAPAIPTRFVTRLDRDKLSRPPGGSFGCQSSRFTTAAGGRPKDVPGPGTYVSQGTLDRRSASVSQKGLGNGFVSRTPRGSGGASAPSSTRFPGPGAYSVADTAAVLSARTGPAGPRGGSTFGRDTSRRGVLSQSSNARGAFPGPQDYNASSTAMDDTIGSRSLRAAAHPHASFASATTRSGVPRGAARDAPGPGSYRPESLGAMGSAGRGHASAFSGPARDPLRGQQRKSRTTSIPATAGGGGSNKSSTTNINNNNGGGSGAAIGGGGGGGGDVGGVLGSPTSHAAGHGAADPAGPGPGSYSVGGGFGPAPPLDSARKGGQARQNRARDHSRRRKPFSSIRAVPERPRSAAAVGKALDTPGPGEYEPAVPGRRLAGAGAAFARSETRPRTTVTSTKAKPPGPAYYAPKSFGRKSFHLNASSSWV